jgi:hypothetical protein
MGEKGIVTLDPIWGLPPDTFVSNNMIENTMPVATITPQVPVFSLGLSLYKTEKAWPQYNELLNAHGFKLRNNSIKVAFLADNFPTDTFSNEYGESFINKITDIASQGAGELAQVLGARTATGSVREAGDVLAKIGGKLSGGAGAILSKVGTAAGEGARKTEAALATLGTGEGLGAGGARAVGLINRMLAGARVDFPQVWKNSGFTPSYQLTIRLYNPAPGNDYSTKKYIIGPIIALLLLATPQTSDGQTYTWPFLQTIKCPGLFELSPSFIGSTAVIKGGDQQSIAYNQRMGIVDVRLDIGSLYNSMVVGKTKGIEGGRPTLQQYAKNLAEKGSTADVYESPVGGYAPTPIEPPTPASVQRATTRTVQTTTPTPRVPEVDEDIFDDLVDRARGFLGL